MSDSSASSSTTGMSVAAPALAEIPVPPHVPVHVCHRGRVRVAAPPHQAFHLFTAPGEKHWVPGWDPLVLTEGDGREKGAVFITRHGDEETTWLVVDFDTENHYVRYARFSPGERAGSVQVRLEADGPGGSVAEVVYALTSLSPRGSKALAGFDAGEFARMMEAWERAIRTADIDYRLLAGDEEQTHDS